MKDHAPTVIYCVTADGDCWQATGVSRPIAEAYYMMAIAQEVARPPVYRIVIQNKVDQHDQRHHQQSLVFH